MRYIFAIKFDCDDKELEAIKNSIDWYKNMNYYERFEWHDNTNGYVTWETYKKDISKISEIYSDILITVYKEREGNKLLEYENGTKIYGDNELTVTYFKYGKFTKEKKVEINIQISFELFDENDEFLSS